MTVREAWAERRHDDQSIGIARVRYSGGATYANFFSTVAGTNVLSAALGTARRGRVSKIAAAWDDHAA